MAGTSAGVKKSWLKRVRHAKKIGVGRAVRRLRSPANKMHMVMSAFKRGFLTSSSGHPVTNHRQAIAIGLAMSRRK